MDQMLGRGEASVDATSDPIAPAIPEAWVDHREPGPGGAARDPGTASLALAVVILGIAGVLRLFALHADPPWLITSDIISDEAWWAHNARNHALDGRWVVDDFNEGLVAAPLFTALVRLSFLVGGVTLEQIRLVSALSGLLCIALVGILIARELGGWPAVAGMAILGFDEFAVAYDRVGFIEPLPACLMTLAATLATATRPRGVCLFVSGVVAVLAAFAKTNAIFFAPALFLFVLTRPAAVPAGGPRGRLRIRARDATLYAAGGLACLAAWIFAFILPNWEEYLLQNGCLRNESKVGGGMLLTNLFAFGLMSEGGVVTRHSAFLVRARLPVMLASLWAIHSGLVICRRGIAARVAPLTDLERLALCWIAGFLPYFVINMNRADRRFYVFLIPLTILAAHVIGPHRSEVLRFERDRGRVWSIPRVTLGLSLIALPLILYLRVLVARALPAWTETINVGTEPGLSSASQAAVATAVLLLGWFLLAPLAFRVLRTTRLRVGVIAAAIIAIVLPLQIFTVTRAAAGLSFTLKHACDQAHRLIGDEARVVDGSALVFATRSRNLIMLDRRFAGYPFFGKRYIPSFRPTHVALSGVLSESEFAREARELLSGWGQYVPGSLYTFRYCPDESGKMRYGATFGKVTPP